MTKIDPIGPKDGEIPHISFSPLDEYHIIVTGGGLYKFFSFKTNDKKFVELHSQINNKSNPRISDKITCHTWSSDSRLIVCTAEGDVIICHESGEFKSVLPDSPNKGEKIHIVSVAPWSRGLVLGGKHGEIVIFDKQEDMEAPFKFMKQEQYTVERATTEKPAITSIAITSTEDMIFFITSNNQLVRLNISLDVNDDETFFNSVIYDFHSARVTGLDVCIRKQLAVTCSEDKSI